MQNTFKLGALGLVGSLLRLKFGELVLDAFLHLGAEIDELLAFVEAELAQLARLLLFGAHLSGQRHALVLAHGARVVLVRAVAAVADAVVDATRRRVLNNVAEILAGERAVHAGRRARLVRAVAAIAVVVVHLLEADRRRAVQANERTIRMIQRRLFSMCCHFACC